MNEYFQHPFISNSDIKAFKKSVGIITREDPENLQAIFDFGSLFHATILEPHLAKRDHADYALAKQMRDSFWADPTCRGFASSRDYHREQPAFNEVQVGPYKAKFRCKMDGVRTGLKIMLELKGLGVESEKAFREALVRNDYDQAIVHYMLTADMRMALIVGISKKDPRMLFKWYVKKHDEFYLGGEQKLIDSLTMIREFSPEDVVLA